MSQLAGVLPPEACASAGPGRAAASRWEERRGGKEALGMGSGVVGKNGMRGRWSGWVLRMRGVVVVLLG